MDGKDNVYVSDAGNKTIRQITPAGEVTTVAGLTGSGGSADGRGSAARCSHPSGVATDKAGNIYVADRFNHTVRKITPVGEVRTLAGFPGSSGSADGRGSAARFNQPTDVAIDRSGNLYVADLGNNAIRKITPGGEVTTLVGLAESGSAARTGDAAPGLTTRNLPTP